MTNLTLLITLKIQSQPQLIRITNPNCEKKQSKLKKFIPEGKKTSSNVHIQNKMST